MDRSREESHPEAVRWGEGRVGVKKGEKEREKEGGREHILESESQRDHHIFSLTNSKYLIFSVQPNVRDLILKN